ncbi:helix-turn-helix protein [Flavobacterium chryseum]|uniref:helix-turn-helix domain-containing protein n=1 Tax=Flavobacterium sp. P3160 TaxID=2512113 RepID=UPI00105D1E6C|nr:helix-turn-helix domain-containing protein [Flavobacterium sp. P3160]TDO66944.1 helix-turn-helix protein [Flavobacterium sp. P3160]
MNQQEINFDDLFHYENKISNQEHFERNKERFSNQCRIVYEALLRGERLTTTKALIDYQIGDLRRRIKDLKDIWNVPISWEYKEGKYKEFFLTINKT